jgi:hypothetical protein
MVGRIATGEIEDTADPKAPERRAAKAKGGAARAWALTPKARSAIAQSCGG